MEVVRGGVQGELRNSPVSVFGIRIVDVQRVSMHHQVLLTRLFLTPATEKTQPEGGTFLFLKKLKKKSQFY